MRKPVRLSVAERSDLLSAPTLTLPQTAQVLGVGLSALRDALKRGDLDLPVISVGKRKLIPTSTVRALIGMGEVRERVDQ